MPITSVMNANAAIATRFRSIFKTRDFLFHDGSRLRRCSVAGRTQAVAAGLAAVTVAFSAYGMGHAALDTAVAGGIVEAEVAGGPRRGLDAHVGEEPGDDQAGHGGPPSGSRP